MGHVYVNVKVTNPQTGASFDGKALVDTGATNTILPKELADQLGLKTTSKRKVRTAKGYVDVWDSLAEIEIDAQKTTMSIGVASSATIKMPIIGVTTLELLELAVDPVSGKLVKSELIWMTFVD